MDGRREPSADAKAPKSSTSSQQAARELILSNPNPSPPSVTPNDGIRTTISQTSTKYYDYSDNLATTCDPAARLPGLRQPPKPPFDDDDNVSVSTDASCGSDLSWETGSETGRKGRKGKKKGVARVARKVSKFSKRLLKWLAWFASRLAFWAAQNAAVAAEWAAEEAELAAKVSKRLAGGLTRRKRGRR